MDNLTDAQFEAAEARGQAALETEPRATAARYSRKTGRVTVDLVNGCTYVFPAHLVQDLSDASPDELASVEVDDPFVTMASCTALLSRHATYRYEENRADQSGQPSADQLREVWITRTIATTSSPPAWVNA